MQRAMKWLFSVLATVSLLCGGFIVLHSSLPPASINAWLSAGNLSAPRAGAATVLLQDGRLLVTGGNGASGALATTDIFDTSGNFSAGPPMHFARMNHTATLLQDGRVLVAGGTDASGRASQTAELFDPAASSWSSAGPLMVGRSGATATLLPSGQVLIAGGTANGAALASLELFDPNLNTFTLVTGTLSSPRENHAAALLPDGRVLILGGWDGTTSAPVPPATTGNANILASSDVFDPTTGTVTPGPAMTTPRMNFTATTQLDGSVAAIGGTDGQNDLASIEVLSPAAGAFALSGAQLTTAREGHLAFLLPHNGNILVVGGTAGGAATASAELYTPWTGATSVTGAMASARSGASGSPLFETVQGNPVGIDGMLIVAGGQDASTPPNTLASAEVYGFATIKTDQADYPPGTPVTITGSGWQPGETVQMSLVEVPDLDGDSPISLTATADASGNISNSSFATNIDDLNVHFTLTAVGSASQAQTTFTDAKPQSVTVGTQSPNPVPAGSSATYTVTVGFNGNSTIACTVDLSVSGLPAGASSGGFSPPFPLTSIGPDQTATLTINTTASAATGSHSFTVTATPENGACQSGASAQSGTGALIVTTPVNVNTTTMVASSANPSVVGQSVSFTATVSSGSGTPTGNVQFKIDSVNFGSPVALSGGMATSGSTSTLTLGNHTIEADYLGATGFNTSNGTLTQTVNKAATTTAVGTISPEPSVVGQSYTVNFSVTVNSPGTGTPTGTVTVDDGTGGTCSAAVSVGSCSFASTSTGSKTITASYGGDTNFSTSSGTKSHTVNKAETTTTVGTITPEPSVIGQSYPVAWSVTVNSPGTGTPTGTVTVDDGTGGTCSAAVSVGSCSFASTSAGAKTITASYGGDTNFNTSSGTKAHTVNKANTSTAVSSSMNPSVFGQSVSFTANVTVVSPGAGSPSGTVQFKVDGSPFGSPVTLVGGVATSSATTTLSVANHTVEADYSGDSNFNVSDGTLSGGQIVNKADTSTSVSSSANPSVFGQSVSFTANVTVVSPGAGTPGGTVQFKVDGSPFGSPVTLVGGVATSSASTTLPVGNHTVEADYAGDSNFNTSNGTLSGGQTVNKADTSTSVSSSANPSVFGQSVSFTANVSVVSPGAGTPGGTVQFKVDGSPFGSPVTLVGGVATSSATTTLSVANHTVEADYSGDSNFNVSNGTLAGGQVVNKAETTTTVGTIAPEPSVTGQSYSVSWSVTVNSPGAGTPTGTVTVDDGTGGTCSAAVSAGSCSFASTSAGAKTITATYGGDADFNSSSGTKAHTVDKADTTTTVGTITPEPTVTGQSYSVAWSVTVNAPGAGTPTGTVTVDDGTGGTCSAAVSAGSCSFASTSAGAKTITATYGGDSNFNGSHGTKAHTVNRADTTAAVTSDINPSVFGQTVTLKATVTVSSPGSGTPTGSVAFYDGVSNIGTGTLSGNQATLMIASLTASGSPHSITAVYGGDLNFNPSPASPIYSQMVNKANTSTGVTSAPNPSTVGQSVTFTATVTNTSGTPPTPTGAVQFVIDSSNFGSPVTVVGGVASISTSTLTAGPHTVQANYVNSDGNFVNSSGSLADGQVVDFGFAGLFDPYAPPPGRGYKVNSAIPLKWDYTDIIGNVVPSSNASPIVKIYAAVGCGDTSTGDVLSIVAPGNSGYQYDPGSNSWQFNWKTGGNIGAGCYVIYIYSNLTGQTSQGFPIQLVR